MISNTTITSLSHITIHATPVIITGAMYDALTCTKKWSKLEVLYCIGNTTITPNSHMAIHEASRQNVWYLLYHILLFSGYGNIFVVLHRTSGVQTPFGVTGTTGTVPS